MAEYSKVDPIDRIPDIEIDEKEIIQKITDENITICVEIKFDIDEWAHYSWEIPINTLLEFEKKLNERHLLFLWLAKFLVRRNALLFYPFRVWLWRVNYFNVFNIDNFYI